MDETIRDFESALRSRLDLGPFRIGEVQVLPKGAGAELRHCGDEGRTDLECVSDPHEAIAIARFDDAEKYRPLKTAPNLRHGWQLNLSGLREILLALDFFYPAAFATAEALARGALTPVNLRDTLARQSGMYAVVRKIDDVQARELVGNVCRGTPGCLRQILWKVTSDESALPGRLGTAGEIPLLCVEACNLLVAAGREVVKGKPADAA